MKDPLLQSYTFEELMYEFHSVREHEIAASERVGQEDDMIELAKEQSDQEWADRMEAEEAAEEAAKEAAKIKNDPSKDPANIAWMEKQLALDKETFGEDFGKDLTLDFDTSKKMEP